VSPNRALARRADPMLTHSPFCPISPERGAADYRLVRPPCLVLSHYKGYPHGMHTVHSEVISADLLAFVRG